MQDNTQNVAIEEVAETKVFSLPAIFTVYGARDLSGTIDLTDFTAQQVQDLINQACKVLSQRASASIDGLDNKLKAEADKFEQVRTGKYQAGTRKTSEPSSVEDRAELQLLMRLFKTYGANTVAKQKKLAKQDNPWKAYYMQAISVKLNREDVSDAEVDKVMEAQSDAIKAMIAKEVEAVKAEDERKAKGEIEVDFADILKA